MSTTTPRMSMNNMAGGIGLGSPATSTTHIASSSSPAAGTPTWQRDFQDADQLFRKYGIAEIRVMEQRLRYGYGRS